MGKRIDVGAYFDKLTKQGSGGRRDVDGTGARGKLRDLTRKTIDKARHRTSSTRPSSGAVSIEYTPNRDNDPDPGEVVWTWVPFEEDPTQGKDRPVVVIGRRGSKLVGVPLTSRSDDREAQVNVGTGGWDPQQRVSYARIWRMLDIEADSMRREGAILDRRTFDAVVAAVDRYYDVTYPAGSGKRTSTTSSHKAPDF
ncbi:MAG TPA: type II toxin-antitoxin system PemK/MazF family toxin [Ilumatobacter sp.]|nr:type II toxin-antitoxin system PemK/MazF family toxin [Ilumatobacter sp.]